MLSTNSRVIIKFFIEIHTSATFNQKLLIIGEIQTLFLKSVKIPNFIKFVWPLLERLRVVYCHITFLRIRIYHTLYMPIKKHVLNIQRWGSRSRTDIERQYLDSVIQYLDEL